FVAKYATFAADAFGDKNAGDAGRPDHSSWMELHELHVHQIRAGVVRECMTIARVFPTVARDLIRSADTPCGEHDCLYFEQQEPSALTIVAKRSNAAVLIFQKADDGAFHVDVDALMNAVILKRTDHFQARAIADMGEPRKFMSAEVALQNLSVFRSIK